MKTCLDSWVVAKKSDQREVYVIVNQRNANLIEINGRFCFSDLFLQTITFHREEPDLMFLVVLSEEVKKLCGVHFSNIFFTD